MNKAEFVAELAKRIELPKTKSKLALEATLDIIQEQVAAGESVEFVGFGSFVSTELQEREGRNPSNGEAMNIPARLVPRFKVGKTFKELVAGKK